jgi:hypothetical protein
MRSVSAVVGVAGLLMVAACVELAVASTWTRGHVRPSPIKLSPVATFNATQYLGRWYQMYQDLLSNVTFEASA